MNAKITMALGAALSFGLAACVTETKTDAAAIAPATAGEAIVADDTAATIEPVAATAEATIETSGDDSAADATMVDKDDLMAAEGDAKMKKDQVMTEEGVTPAAADASEGAIEAAIDGAAEAAVAATDAVELAPQN